MGYDVERYLSVRQTHGPSFSPDGERLAFLSDSTGVLQLWTLDAPGAQPTQWTTFRDRITFGSWSPARRELVFGMDRDGDGKTQLYRLSETGEIDPLTDAPGASHRWGGWSSDGRHVAFAANRNDLSSFDIYIRSRDPLAESECVLKTDGWYDVLGWGPNDERLLLRKTSTSLDHELAILDLERGDERAITPSDEPARYQSANWSPQSDAIYVVTDYGADTNYLARIEIETGELESIVDGGSWNIDGLNVDTGTGNLAYGRNVDGYTEITTGRLIDARTVRTYPKPDLPNGVLGEVTFGPDADRFAVTATTRRKSPTIYVVEIETGETTQWTRPSHADIPRESFVEPELVRYEGFDGLEISALFSLPKDGQSVPALVDLHGGPESQRRPSFDPIRQFLLHRGYALFEPNVRGSTGYGKTFASLDDVRNRFDAIADVRAGAEWLGKHERIDPDRIAVFGPSYGGYLALMCLACHDVWAAGGCLCGITDLVTFLENTGAWRREIREAEYGSLSHDRDFLERASPINNVEDIDVPVLVMHGENDPRVPVDAALEFADQIRERGQATVRLFEDEGHSISKEHNRATAFKTLVSFLGENI